MTAGNVDSRNCPLPKGAALPKVTVLSRASLHPMTSQSEVQRENHTAGPSNPRAPCGISGGLCGDGIAAQRPLPPPQSSFFLSLLPVTPVQPPVNLLQEIFISGDFLKSLTYDTQAKNIRRKMMWFRVRVLLNPRIYFFLRIWHWPWIKIIEELTDVSCKKKEKMLKSMNMFAINEKCILWHALKNKKDQNITLKIRLVKNINFSKENIIIRYSGAKSRCV